MNYIKLNDGAIIPSLCYGSNIVNYNYENKIKFYGKILSKVIKIKKKELKKDFSLFRILKEMQKNNISAIDTSRAYGCSESIIGCELKRNREKYYIIDKISNRDQYNENIEEAVFDSLNKLNTNYIDLLLLHWPVDEHYINSWKVLERLKNRGLCKSIGVSNFNIHHLERLKKVAKCIPAVNEFECHPLFTQEALRSYCSANNIKVLAYTSTARMDERLFKTCLPDIAKKYNKTVAQIILKWHSQVGNIPIFNTSSIDRYRENLNIFDFELTNEEISNISKININSRLRYDPDNCDFTKL